MPKLNEFENKKLDVKNIRVDTSAIEILLHLMFCKIDDRKDLIKKYLYNTSPTNYLSSIIDMCIEYDPLFFTSVCEELVLKYQGDEHVAGDDKVDIIHVLEMYIAKVNVLNNKKKKRRTENNKNQDIIEFS